jgi:hypothetical protein
MNDAILAPIALGLQFVCDFYSSLFKFSVWFEGFVVGPDQPILPFCYCRGFVLLFPPTHPFL